MDDFVTSSLPLGAVIHDRYRVQAVVGRGGLGTVYQVVDLLFGKGNTYALKELVDQSPGARKQFELECQWLQSLNHPNIPKFREYFDWEGRLYLVMDFVAGENLEQKLVRLGGRGIPEQQAVAWIMPICDALHYLHTRTPPILHRDLKPANIIVTPTGHPVLVDLGIAKEHLPGAGLTSTFVKKAGTEGYAPPEQYTSTGQTGPWSDVYGIGATLYQLLTGSVPPTAVDRIALDAKLLRPRDVNPMLSGQTDAAVCRALALRPAERFTSVLDFSNALMGVPIAPNAESTHATPRVAPLSAPMQSNRTPTYGPAVGLPPLHQSTPQRSHTMPPAPGIMPGSAAPYPNAPRLVATPPSMTPRPNGATPPGLSQPQRATNGPLRQPLPPPRTPTSPGLPSEPDLDEDAEELYDGDDSHESRFGLTGGRLILAIVALLVVLIVGAGGAFLLLSTPPDRSTPRASITGYYNALSQRDYQRAWQFSDDSRSAVGKETGDIQSYRAEDARTGAVKSVTIDSLNQGSPNQAIAQVTVVRGNGNVNYTLTLTEYDGNVWLITAISS